MKGCIPKALTKFQQDTPKRKLHSPYKHVPIKYGQKIQIVITDDSNPVSSQQIKHIQNVVGTLLYYARAVDPTLAAALSTIASE
eukprot:12400392-Ditylum_brightwellii.AAC.1